MLKNIAPRTKLIEITVELVAAVFGVGNVVDGGYMAFVAHKA